MNECTQFLADHLKWFSEKVVREGQQQNPFCVLLDLRSYHGRQFAEVLRNTKTEIDNMIRVCPDTDTPIVRAVISWDIARAITPYIAPNAKEKLDALWQDCQESGLYPVFVVTQGFHLFTPFDKDWPLRMFIEN